MSESSAKEDYQKLLEFSVKFAEQQLAKNRTFFPFGATIKTMGELSPSGVDGLGEHPTPQAIIEQYSEGFRRDIALGAIRATCICFDGTVQTKSMPKSDAITCDMEHHDGSPMRIFVPYRIEADGRITLGEVMAGALAGKLFLPAGKPKP